MRTNKNPIVKTSLVGLAAAAFLCAGIQQAGAAVLANYTFQSSNGNSSDTDANSTAGTFGGTGLTVTYNTTPWPAGTIGIRATTASMPTAQTTVNYYSFTITPNAGYTLDLAGTAALTFQYGRNNWAPGAVFSWAAYASTDNFATGTSLGTGSTASGNALNNASLNMTTAFNGVGAGGVQFRVYVWDGGDNNANRYGYLDNVVLNGVSVVPEPVNVALGIFGLCAVVVGVGRRYLTKHS